MKGNLEDQENQEMGCALLVQAVIKNFVSMIEASEFKLRAFGILHKKRWLEKQLPWIAQDNFWFDAYEEFFGYNANQAKSKIISKINNKLGVPVDKLA